MLFALVCRPFQYEKDPVEDFDRIMYRKGYAHVIDSRMQVATRFSERVSVWGIEQVKPQVLRRLPVREHKVISIRHDL